MVLSVDLELVTLVFSTFSLLSSIWISIIFYRFPDLHRHPAQIVSWISLCQIGISQHIITLLLGENILWARTEAFYLLDALTFFTLEESQIWNLTCIISQWMFTACLSAMVCYNISLGMDLAITVRNPLISGKARMKYYHFVTFAMVLLQVVCNVWNTTISECSNEFRNYLAQLLNFGYMIYLMTTYLLTAVITLGFTWAKLGKNALMQHKTAKRYFRRHFLYVFVFWVVWGSAMVDYFEKVDDNWVQYLSYCLVSLSGFILVTIRCFQKVFWEKSLILCCKKQEKPIRKQSDDLWNKPISYLVYDEMKEQASLCILQGLSYSMQKSFKADEEIFSSVKYSVELPEGLKGMKTATKFTAKMYAPGAFNNFILTCGVDLKMMIKSIKPKYNTKATLLMHESKGRSGNIFLCTDDNRLLLKTIDREEKQNLIRKMLPDYLEHMRRHPNSLLCKIYGVFTVKIPGVAPIHLLILENLEPGGVKRYYDLKGSILSRYTKVPYEGFKGPFKDGDFVNHKRSIKIPENDRKKLIEILENDVKFLLKFEIMDYSLLLYVIGDGHPCMVNSTEGCEGYNFSLIDYLSTYSYKRKVEYAAKAFDMGLW